MLLVVPHERRDPLVTGDPEAFEPVRELRDALADGRVAGLAVSVSGRGDHLPVRVPACAVPQDRGDRQREILHSAVHCTPIAVVCSSRKPLIAVVCSSRKPLIAAISIVGVHLGPAQGTRVR